MKGSARRVLLALCLVPGLLAAPALGNEIRDVRHWAYPHYTRVVIELTETVEVAVHRLPASAAHRRPERLYFDLPGMRGAARRIDVGDGLVRGIRIGQNRRDRARVVLDLDRSVHHRVIALPDPARIVLDIYAEPPGKAAALDATRRSVVVLDPGHGGRDPGAMGLGGVREKDVTLYIAKALRKELEARDFEVVMTRDGDRSLALEERTALAQAKRADLFLSIHANAAPNIRARGIETYYLDRGSRRQTLRVAARENGTTPARLDALQKTLAGLRIGESALVSSRLAHHVHDTLIRGLRVEGRQVADLGVKKGPFQVLFLTDMPAILVEVGFLTHPGDARRLRDPGHRRALATHLARGVERFSARRALELAGGIR